MFQDSMNKALQHVPGALGCMLLGFDGIPIASVFTDASGKLEGPLLAMSVETAHVLKKMHKMAEEGELSYIGELALMGEALVTTARVVQREYLLVLAMSPEADMDEGLRMLRLMAPWIEREM